MKADVLKELLIESNCDKTETDFIIDGFTNGFSLGYEGDKTVRRFSPNLKLECGMHFDLWHKMSKEVELK